MPPPSMSVRFWGVRGSVPCPGPNTVRYGGQTSCVEVRCGDQLFVFDTGSGIHQLGGALQKERKAQDVDIFFSHCHIDHVIGLPFFGPLFEEGHRLRLFCGHMKPHGGLKSALARLMSFPLFPIGLEMAKAKLEFHDFEAGETLTPRPGVTIRTAPLIHPGGATGYRLEYQGQSVVYLTDLELDGKFNPGILALATGASVLIVDATYTDDELPSHAGWGHSSWQQVVRLAKEAKAKTLCLFHHDPDHDDAFMDRIAAASAAALPGTVVARDGLIISL